MLKLFIRVERLLIRFRLLSLKLFVLPFSVNTVVIAILKIRSVGLRPIPWLTRTVAVRWQETRILVRVTVKLFLVALLKRWVGPIRGRIQLKMVRLNMVPKILLPSLVLLSFVMRTIQLLRVPLRTNKVNSTIRTPTRFTGRCART